MSQNPVSPIDILRQMVSKFLDTIDQNMPIAATVVFNVNAKKEKIFVKNSEALADATRKLPGCNIFAYHEQLLWQPGSSSGNVLEYLIYEDWETVKLFRTQWDSEHLKRFQYSVGDLVVGMPVLKFHYGWADNSGSGRLPKTGQKFCWSSSGELIDCAGTGQDGEFQAGLASPVPRFADNNDGTVTDRLTGLIWLQDADRFGEVRWDQALENARNLSAGSCGLNDNSKPGDWRLPNIREFFSLIDYGKADPIISDEARAVFKNVRSSIYWSSTTLAAAPTLAWMMTLGIGPTVFDLKINPNRMWAVRGKSSVVLQTGQKNCYDPQNPNLFNPFEFYECGGTGQDGELQTGVPWSDPRFTDNNDGTVTDNVTSLVWLKNADPFGLRTWEQALKDCNNLSSGNYGLTDNSKSGDWRLPNINEIESLIDYGSFGPCLPNGGQPFENLRPSSYWTSTSVTEAPTEAMFIILGVGPSIFESKEHTFFVFPVRDRKSAG